MAKNIDLRVKMCGLTFKNPLLAASSEIAHDVRDIKKCIEHGFGGIVLKTCAHPSVPIAGRRPIPNMSSLRPLGREFRASFLADMLTSYIPRDEYIEKQLPEIIKRCREAKVPLIGSIAASHEVEDWIEMAEMFSGKGVDMLELNMSCPHKILVTQQRDMGSAIGADPELATQIIRVVKKSVSVPVSVKMSPNLEQSSYFAKVYTDAGADALTAHSSPLGLVIDTEREEVFGTYSGGYLPGRTFLPISLDKIRHMMRVVNVPISGAGGIVQADDAIQYFLLGCPTVQLCTAIFVYGYGVVPKILKGIIAWMGKKGYTSVEEFRGKVKPRYPEEVPLWEPFKFLPPDIQVGPAEIEIDKDKCNLCCACADACLYDALEIDTENKVLRYQNERCYNCGMCIGLCKVRALRLVERDTGELVWDGRGTQRKLLPKAVKRQNRA